MARFLFTTQPMAGHLRPLLPVARALTQDGHDVLWYTGARYGALVERSGARAVPYPAGLDFDDTALEHRGGDAGGRRGLKGLEQDIIEVFVRPVPGHVAVLDALLRDAAAAGSPVDAVIAESGFVAGPFAAERHGLPSLVVSVTPLGLSSVDVAPFGLGLAPASSPVGRLRNRSLNWLVRSVLLADAQRAAEQVRAALGMPALPGYFMDWGALVADRYLAPTVPELEYPRRDLPANVEFVGAIVPRGVDGGALPGWWADVLDARAAGRPVVVVTQGTIATDPANLVLPAVRALADQDVLVVATTHGHAPDDVLPPAERPANARLTEFVPFAELLPLADVLVSNGGFGGVQSALAHGVPVVVAGTTEDKAEVGARVAWAGVGVALRTDSPTPDQVAASVRRVLDEPGFRDAARVLAVAYARQDGAARVAQVAVELALGTAARETAERAAGRS